MDHFSRPYNLVFVNILEKKNTHFDSACSQLSIHTEIFIKNDFLILYADFDENLHINEKLKMYRFQICN